MTAPKPLAPKSGPYCFCSAHQNCYQAAVQGCGLCAEAEIKTLSRQVIELSRRPSDASPVSAARDKVVEAAKQKVRSIRYTSGVSQKFADAEILRTVDALAALEAAKEERT